MFTEQTIDKIFANGSMAYCEVSVTTEGQISQSQQINMWGKIPRGLNMDTSSSIYVTPKPIKGFSRHGFNKIFINHDFATAIGHSVKLKFNVQDDETNEQEYS